MRALQTALRNCAIMLKQLFMKRSYEAHLKITLCTRKSTCVSATGALSEM